MSNQNKTLAERLAEARADSPLNDMTVHQAAVRASNELKRGVPTNVVSKGAFKEGNKAWNKGKNIGTETWGKTRKERAEQMSEEERRAYFGYHEHHTKETKKQMSNSAKNRWAKTMKRVMAEGVEYDNHYAAAEALGIHKDTIIYRIKNKSAKWEGWYYINEK
jgi:hypothetical protein